MATGPKNAKSQSVTARIAHEIIEGMENVKEEGESTGQFINASHARRNQTPPAPQGQRAGIAHQQASTLSTLPTRQQIAMMFWLMFSVFPLATATGRLCFMCHMFPLRCLT